MIKTNLYIHRRYAIKDDGEPVEEVQYWSAAGNESEQFTNQNDERLTLNHPIAAFAKVPMGIRYVDLPFAADVSGNLADYNARLVHENLRIVDAKEYQAHFDELPFDEVTQTLYLERGEDGFMDRHEYDSRLKAEQDEAAEAARVRTAALTTTYRTAASESPATAALLAQLHGITPPDDFTTINNIGNGTQSELDALGIHTYAQLIAADPAEVVKTVRGTAEDVREWQNVARELMASKESAQ